MAESLADLVRPAGGQGALLALFLRLAGYTPAVAGDGLEAVAVAERFQPQVVLLNPGLPGLDGIETGWRIRQIPGLERVTLIAGFTRVFLKPLDFRQLEESLTGR